MDTITPQDVAKWILEPSPLQQVQRMLRKDVHLYVYQHAEFNIISFLMIGAACEAMDAPPELTNIHFLRATFDAAAELLKGGA
jgi:hypothetical protein